MLAVPRRLFMSGWSGRALGIAALCLGACSGGGTRLATGSPWPKFRMDAAQTGRSTIRPAPGGRMWSFPTGKGIFSSPVVAADGTIYVGSADRTFYALDPAGGLKWQLLTGEIIDSAALLDDRGRVYFGSGDGNLRALEARSGALVWQSAADDPTVNGGFINWFEGNVALSPTGALYAPNDDFFVYSIDRDSGTITGRMRMPDQIWSSPAFDGAGRLWLGNNNVVDFLGSNFFAFDAHNADVWDSFIGLGSVAASPLYVDGLVIVGGFDGYLRAFDAASGALRWQFAARDHIYASPARAADGTIVQPAADGTVYALDEKSGALKWSYDTSDPIRSSPAIDGDGNIYFGGGDGSLHVLNRDGTPRFAVQLIAADRNDLNSSPALGRDAVYIGGESGELFSVPYDYCRSSGQGDPRCAPPAPPPVPADGAALLFTTAFGSQTLPPSALAPNEPIVLSLVVRQAGQSQLALLDAASVQVTFSPSATSHVDVAGNGRFLIITPDAPLAADASGNLTLTVRADYFINPDRDGLRLSGGTRGGQAAFSATMALAPANASPFAVAAGSTWQVGRLALPLPTLLPSYNQIGFDSLEYLVSIVESGQGHTIAWMVGAKLAADSNATVIDPATAALFPLEASYAGGFLTLLNSDGVRVLVSNATIPLASFRLAATLGSDGNASGAARVTGSTICGKLPVYGSFLQRLGLCNPESDALAISGAANFTRFEGALGPAPADVGSVAFAASAGAVTATLTGSSVRLADHVAALLLVDAASGAAVSLDYGLVTRRTADAAGRLASVTLPLGDRPVPSTVEAYLMIDLLPVASARLTLP
jgi:outer membrane protein assembly factor BamB